jgi:hypothetical protein
MPIKRRIAKHRQFAITPEAVRRWREVRAWGIGPVCIDDDALGDALGLPALLAMRSEDLEALTAALDEAADHTD